MRRLFIAGAVCGAAFTIAISLSMDVFYADALGGTWRDAIRGDLGKLGIETGTGSPLVTVVFLLVLLALGAFGAFAGLIFTAFIYRFINMLLKEKE